jgi:hypothetical protein
LWWKASTWCRARAHSEIRPCYCDWNKSRSIPSQPAPQMTKGKTVSIYTEIGEQSSNFDLVLLNKAGEVLREVGELINIGVLPPVY